MSLVLGLQPQLGVRSQISRAINLLRAKGADAHLWDFSTLTGLYQDSAGTTPVTAVDQPIGLVLDSMRVLGSELVVNGDFSAGTTGWTAGSIGTGSISAASGVLTVQLAGGDAYGNAYQAISVVSGKTYKLTGTVVSGSTGAIIIGISATSTGATIPPAIGNGSTAGTYSSSWVAPSTATYYVQAGANNADATGKFSSISVREITGIHASQATSAKKPTLRRGIVNRLTYSHDLSNAAWVTSGSASKTGSTQINFTASALDKVTHTTTSGTSSVGMTWTQAVVLSGSGTVKLNLYDDGGAYPGTNSAPIVLSGTPTLYLVTRTHADAVATKMACQVFNFGAALATVTFGGAALFTGTLTASEILAYGGIPLTTSAPASSSQGRYWAEFDGANDALTLGSVPFQMADDHAVVGGVSPASASNNQTIFGLRNASNTAALLWVSSGKIGERLRNDASVQVDTLSASLMVPGVVSLKAASANHALRFNGAAVGSSTSSGVYTLNTATIGADTSTTTLNFFNGAISSVSAIKSTLTDAELLLIEKLAANKAGVSL
jgi:hypothetical protein